jgi:hypothetical protein
MFVLNRDNLGKNSAPIGTVAIAPGCWCAASYFEGSDGVGRVVTSTGGIATGSGATLAVWQVKAISSAPYISFQREFSVTNLQSGQDPGFFTTVSSNGTQAGTAIIWGLLRPNNTGPNNVLLYAWDAANGSQLISIAAGSWPRANDANANLVPVVANGRVYVASYKQLAIFGLGGTPAALLQPTAPAPTPLPADVHEIYGKVTSVNGNLVSVERNGQVQRVDVTPAVDASQSVPVVVGQAIRVRGTLGFAGVLQAQSVVRTKSSPALWPPDR